MSGVRRIVAALLVLVLTSGAAASAQDRDGASPPAFQQLTDCLAERGHLLLLVLMDQSGSLRDSDPDGRRVDGLSNALKTLASYGTEENTIDVLFTGFSTAYEVHSPWLTLIRESGPVIEREAAAYRERNTGGYTDFVTALDGAQASLTARVGEIAPAGGPPPCRAVLLFTDGEYDIRDDAREPAGQRAVCDPGGIADQLREAGTTIVAIGLIPAQDPPDQTFLRSIADPSSASGADRGACGVIAEPAGTYIPVTSVDQLVEAFDALLQVLKDGTPVPRSAAATTVPFSLTTSMSAFHLLLDVGAAPVTAELRAPGVGQPLALRAGERGNLTLGAAEIEYGPASPTHLVVDGRLPPGAAGWAGTWTVTFVDPDASTASRPSSPAPAGGPTGQAANDPGQVWVTLFGGLTPVVEPPPTTLREGEAASFDVWIEDVTGAQRAPQALLDALEVTATLAYQGEREQRLDVQGPSPEGVYRVTFEVPEETAAGFADLRLVLGVVTQDGLRLKPRPRSYRIQIVPPPSHPTLDQPELRLSPIIDEGEARGSLEITGGEEGGGCVWFDRATFSRMPPGTGQITVTPDPPAVSEASCISVGPGQRREVTVVAEPAEVRAGRVSGEIVAHLSSDNDPAVIERRVPVSFEMDQSRSTARFGLVFLLLLLTGVAVPTGAMYLMNWWTARFREPGLVRAASKRVRVTGDIVREENGGALRVTRHDFGAMNGVDTGSARAFDFDGLCFETKVPRLPVRLPYGTVASASGKHTLASDGHANANGTLVGRVPLALPDSWALVVDEDEGAARGRGTRGNGQRRETRGTLSLYVSDGEVDQKAQRLLSRVLVELPAALAEVGDTLDGRVEVPPPPQGPADPQPYKPRVPMD